MSTKVKRRLTTVLCADVKSYTRLMESDETGTLERLRTYRSSMKALIARHDGRVVNTWGYALIAEFESVVEAVHAAVEIQQELTGRNRDLPETEQMWFRIGINLGDVMVEEGDIYGDGVNIAARLQELAEPGGIMISRPVFDQVRNKLSLGFDFLGDQAVKNVSEPVPSYRILLDGAPAAGRSPSTDQDPAEKRAELWAQFKALPAGVKTAAILVGFFFCLNLFTGLGSIWFHWPSLSMLLILLLYFSLRRKKGEVP
ncbi:MAG: adenylate/guanylate cyclase domain-containing protein [Geminicoccaceae bacterium]